MDYVLNYRNWAEKAKTNGQEDIVALLEEAAEMSLAVNDRFEKALALIGDEYKQKPGMPEVKWRWFVVGKR